MEMVHFIPPSQRRIALMAAQADPTPVLIHGSSGTGKGAIAKWIHANCPRAGLPFVTAKRDEPLATQIPKAQGGTFYIDEIGELSLSEQKLLLETVSQRSIPHPENPNLRMLVNVRLMASTSRSLDGRAQGGLFNAELLEKLSVYRVEMPELASREDFVDVVEGIVSELVREVHKEHLRQIHADAWRKLKGYDWPGNLRELRNVLRMAVLNAQGDEILAENLPAFGHDQADFRSTREEFERIYLLELLRSFDGEVERASKVAQMDPAAFRAKLERFGIPTPPPTLH